MSGLRRGLLFCAAGLLAVCLVASFLTRGALAHLPFLNGQGEAGLVDQRPWQTAQALAPLAVSKEEQGFAQEAERLADHEVDQAFATALRQANAETTVLTGEALAVKQKVDALQQTVASDQAEVDRLTAAAKGPRGDSYQDELDLSKSELALDKNELDDETAELARASGDKRAELQRELAARKAAMKKYDDQAAGGGEVAVISTQRYGTLYGQMKAWLAQRTREGLLRQAGAQAGRDADGLAGQLGSLRAGSAASGPAGAASGGSGAAGAGSGATGARTVEEKKDRVARLQKRVAARTMANLLQDRVDTDRQLAGVYGRWGKQVGLQHRIVDHLMLNSLAEIAGIVLALALAGLAGRALMLRGKMEPRRQRTLMTILDLVLEVGGLLMVALVVFGAPSQVPTILGLATAGLTVVFQDFILAFFGWFVLMGQNGIRVGDWVEINGVGGEVVEITLFRTALLETGNWTDKGHPTGRRVTFINNFAITGQYFNFSTAGQWMWDEISINVPAAEDTYGVIEKIQGIVTKETEADAEQAEAEWRRAVKTSGLSQFSAAPSVDLRPAAAGVDLKIRYVTRATERFAMRNTIYQEVVGVLQKVGG